MADISLTLSRWHHVANRLRNMAQKLNDEAYETLANTRISSIIDDEQMEAMEKRGQDALNKARLVMIAHQGLGIIRGELSKANNENGVSGLLAVVEALRQERNHLQKLVSVDVLTMPSLKNANEALEKQSKNTTKSIGYLRGEEKDGMALRVVNIDSLDEFKNRIIDVEVEIQALTDEISEINQKAIKIDLPDEVVKMANLK